MNSINLLLSLVLSIQNCLSINFCNKIIEEDKFGSLTNTISLYSEKEYDIYNPNAPISSSVQLNNNYSYSSQYLSRYYRDLSGNILNNKFGSCGYVAIGMILSYYDTYWNDNTIHNTFEDNTYISNIDYLNGNTYLGFSSGYESPGVYHNSSNIKPPSANDSQEEIYNANYNYYDDITDCPYDLQAYLMLSYGEYYNYIDLEEYGPFGLTSSEMYNIMNDYIIYENLTDVYDIYSYDIFSNQYDSNSIKNLAINYIQQGYPVLLGIRYNLDNGKTENHAVVAYECVNNGNTYDIYGHNGYYYYPNSHVNIESFSQIDPMTNLPVMSCQLNCYKNLLVIIPKSNSHVHSNNYKIGNEFYCPCQFEHL